MSTTQGTDRRVFDRGRQPGRCRGACAMRSRLFRSRKMCLSEFSGVEVGEPPGLYSYGRWVTRRIVGRNCKLSALSTFVFGGPSVVCRQFHNAQAAGLVGRLPNRSKDATVAGPCHQQVSMQAGALVARLVVPRCFSPEPWSDRCVSSQCCVVVLVHGENRPTSALSPSCETRTGALILSSELGAVAFQGSTRPLNLSSLGSTRMERMFKCR